MNNLHKCAGFDPLEREIGIGTGNPKTEREKALIRAALTRNRYQRMREASRIAPPVPAKGGFPYNLKTVDQLPKARQFAQRCKALVRHGNMGFRQCRNAGTYGGYCCRHE